MSKWKPTTLVANRVPSHYARQRTFEARAPDMKKGIRTASHRWQRDKDRKHLHNNKSVRAPLHGYCEVVGKGWLSRSLLLVRSCMKERADPDRRGGQYDIEGNKVVILASVGPSHAAALADNVFA